MAIASRSVRSAGDADASTFDPRNPFAAAARFPPLRFDHVFSGWPKPHAIGHPAHAELIGHVPVDGVYGSDHYGVMADLHY